MLNATAVRWRICTLSSPSTSTHAVWFDAESLGRAAPRDKPPTWQGIATWR